MSPAQDTRVAEGGECHCSAGIPDFTPCGRGATSYPCSGCYCGLPERQEIARLTRELARVEEGLDEALKKIHVQARELDSKRKEVDGLTGGRRRMRSASKKNLETIPLRMNAKVAHTPVPWRWDSDHNEITNDQGDCVVAVVVELGLRHKTGEVEANARLIAAAPELLAAALEAFMYTHAHAADCEGVLKYDEPGMAFDFTDGCTCFIARLKAAITKATGATPP